MNNRWRLIALFAVTTLAAGAVGSGGFTTTTADRAVAVDIVGDDNAYMALQYGDSAVTDGTHSFVTIENRFSQPTTVSVELTETQTESNLSVSKPAPLSASLSPGSAFSPELRFVCAATATGDRSATLSFRVTADGESISTVTTRSRTVNITVSCS